MTSNSLVTQVYADLQFQLDCEKAAARARRPARWRTPSPQPPRQGAGERPGRTLTYDRHRPNPLIWRAYYITH